MRTLKRQVNSRMFASEAGDTLNALGPRRPLATLGGSLFDWRDLQG